MHTRPARLSDAAAIAHIHVTTWQHAYRGKMPDALLDGLSVAERTATWTRRLTAPAPRQTFLVAEHDGAVVAFASSGPARGEPDAVRCGELYAIYAHPDHIGTGAGRALLAETADALRARGFAEAILWVLTDNPRAQRAYEAAGWRADGGHKVVDFGGRRLDELRYRLRLTTNS